MHFEKLKFSDFLGLLNLLGPSKRHKFWILDLWKCLKKLDLWATFLKILPCIYCTYVYVCRYVCSFNLLYKLKWDYRTVFLYPYIFTVKVGRYDFLWNVCFSRSKIFFEWDDIFLTDKANWLSNWLMFFFPSKKIMIKKLYDKDVREYQAKGIFWPERYSENTFEEDTYLLRLVLTYFGTWHFGKRHFGMDILSRGLFGIF